MHPVENGVFTLHPGFQILFHLTIILKWRVGEGSLWKSCDESGLRKGQIFCVHSENPLGSSLDTGNILTG